MTSFEIVVLRFIKFWLEHQLFGWNQSDADQLKTDVNALLQREEAGVGP